jgi:hypothetical protein
MFDGAALTKYLCIAFDELFGSLGSLYAFLVLLLHIIIVTSRSQLQGRGR